MQIVQKRHKEVIEVFHNDVEEMHENIRKLQKEGWSGNTRVSVTGVPLCILSIQDVEHFQKQYPHVKVHEDKSIYYGTYVYFTIHEREIK